jgi:membrane-associated protease RseP (regulator of RpoE activity)
MYRTQFGVEAIKKVSDHCKCLLMRLKYVIIAVGVLLMGAMIWMLGQTLVIYVKFPQVVEVIKAPPIAPLIPYFPKLFGMQQFFPPFYFTYFVVALAIVAIVHEFSHGLFMRLFNIKIKSTGLVFLGPILGAFVEEEKKNFEKKKNSEQMTVLGAGVFANVVTALFFYGLYVIFFYASFSPSGYVFNTYGTITAVPVEGIAGFETDGNLTKVITLANTTYYIDQNLGMQLNLTGIDYIVAYSDSPAVRAQLKGVIVQADDVKINNQMDLRDFLQNKEPGDKVVITTDNEGNIENYEVVLGTYPNETERAYLGVGYYKNEPRGVVQHFFATFMSFKEPSTRYLPNWDGNLVYFIYHLLWWVMVINLLVALFNMMPLGMLDGGRFFYLGVLSLTRSEWTAKWAFRIAGYAILFSFVLLMWFWFIRII